MRKWLKRFRKIEDYDPFLLLIRLIPDLSVWECEMLFLEYTICTFKETMKRFKRCSKSAEYGITLLLFRLILDSLIETFAVWWFWWFCTFKKTMKWIKRFSKTRGYGSCAFAISVNFGLDNWKFCNLKFDYRCGNFWLSFW